MKLPFRILLPILLTLQISALGQSSDVQKLVEKIESEVDGGVAQKLILEGIETVANSDDANDQRALYDAAYAAEMEFGHYHKALLYARRSAEAYVSLKDTYNLAGVYSDISLIFDELGEYPGALDMSQRSAKLYSSINDSSGVAYCYNDIGILHYYNEDYDKARAYLDDAFDIFKALNDSMGMGFAYNNIANIYSDQANYEEAIKWYKKGYELDVLTKNDKGQSISLTNTGETYIELKDFKSAKRDLERAVELSEEFDQWHRIAPLSGLASLHFNIEEYGKARVLISRAIQIAEDIDAQGELVDLYELMYKINKATSNYDQAVLYLEKKQDLEHDLFNESNSALMSEMEAKYDVERKTTELEEQKLQNELNDLQHEQEIAKQDARQFYLFLGLGGILLFSGFMIYSFIQKKKANKVLSEQKVIIEEKNDQLENTLLELEVKNKEITDSITYARRIQKAILPDQVLIEQLLPESFVLYMPKDIVAGDFYWVETFSELSDKILFAVADCTGHGVPGAMVSVICNNALNRAVREFKLKNPGEILDKVGDLVLEQFDQGNAKVRDGMDIALCLFDRNTRELVFSGANNPLFVVNAKGESRVVAPNKFPIGAFGERKNFVQTSVTLDPGDMIYLYSDGFQDQFGGKRNKKFKSSNFKNLLTSIAGNRPDLQKEILHKSLNDWKGDFEQIDDICVMGVRI